MLPALSSYPSLAEAHPVSSEMRGIDCIGRHVNKLVENYPSFMKEIERIYFELPECDTKQKLRVIYQQLCNVDPDQVTAETKLILANYNQYTIPDAAGDLGRSACSSIAGEALYRSLTSGILDTHSANEVLHLGMQSYLTALEASNQRGSALIGQLSPGALISWEGMANYAFEGRLHPVGRGPIQIEFSLLDPATSYLSLLQRLADSLPKQPVGAIIHTGGPFFLSAAIHYDAEENPVVFLYDSHGHRALTQSMYAPAFSARSPSLEAAAHLLAFLYPPAPDAEGDHRCLTFYPLQTLQPAPPLASLQFSPAIADATSASFIQQLDETKQFLLQQASTCQEQRDLHALLLKVCEHSIFPTILKASPEEQKLLLSSLDLWLQQLPKDLFSFPNSSSSSKEIAELTVEVINAFAEFLQDYRGAVETAQTWIGRTWIGRNLFSMSHRKMDKKIAAQFMRSNASKKQILERLVRELVIQAGLEPTEGFCQSAAHLLEQVIENALHSSLPSTLMQNLLEDKCITEGFIQKEPSLNTPMTPEMQAALLKMSSRLIDLANPDRAIQLTKIFFLNNSIVNIIKRLIPYFSSKATEELDVVSSVIHLLRKYISQELPVEHLSPEELSKQLSERVFQLTILDQVPSRLGKLAISTFKNYSSWMNLPNCATQIGNQFFLLLQRPEVLSVFIYEYLLQKTVIPRIAEQNAKERQVAVPDIPPLHPLFNQIGDETALFLSRFLKDYVFTSLITDSSLSQATIKTIEEAMIAFLPEGIASSFAAGKSPAEQQRICDFIESFFFFLEDFTVARQRVAHLLADERAAYTQEEKNEILDMCMNQVRRSRGAPLLQRENRQKKLENLTNYFLQNSNLNKAQKEVLQKILPSFLQTAIATLSPSLIQQFLCCLLTPSRSFDQIPSSGLGRAWEVEAIERWNKSMLHLVKNAVRLSGIDHVAPSVLIPILQQMLTHIGTQIASLGSTPSLFFDPAGRLNLLRKLSAALWRQEADGRLVPSMETVQGLSQREKEELKVAIEHFMREKISHDVLEVLPIMDQNMAPINRMIDQLVDAFLELIENPAALELFIYEYVIEDIFLKGSTDCLTRSGLQFDLDPNRASTVEDALKSPNLTLWMAFLHEWQTKNFIPPHIKTLRDVITYLQSINTLSAQNATFLTALSDKKECALAIQYLDYLFNTSNPNSSLDTVPAQQLITQFVQRSIGAILDPALIDRILANVTSENPNLSEDECTVRAIERALQETITQDESSENLFLVDTLTGLQTAKSPLLFLSQFLSGLKQIDFWHYHIKNIHLHHENHSISKFYQEFTRATPHLFGFPLTLRQRATIYSKLQAPLKQASWGDALEISSDWSGSIDVHVCQDSVEGIQQKLNLLRKAKHSIALSGCYFGGQPLTQALQIIHEKLRSNPNFLVYLLGSETMLKPENNEMLEMLKANFPDRFHAVINHEINPFTNPQTGAFFFMGNHVKCLVIDEGTDFLIGGSGMQERWANYTGTEEIEPQGANTRTPLAFRDADYLFHIGTPNGIGRLIYHQLLELCAHCCHMADEDLAKRYFDSRFYPISQRVPDPVVAATNQSGTAHFLYHQFLKLRDHLRHKRIEFFATNPEEASGNGFEERLIELIENAQHRIVINHMYFHPSEALLQALIQASKRDVSIILVTNQDEENAPGIHKLYVPLSRYFWKRLLEERPKENVVVFEYQPPYTTLHKKVIIIDDCVATGSSNCGLLSMQGMNHEYNVIIHSQQIVDQTMDVIDIDIALSKAVSEQENMVITNQDRIARVRTAPLQYFL